MGDEAYIERVHLKGYKSIRDVTISFGRGLNVIIGANGSGKTNFFEFLDAAFATNFNILFKERKFEVEIDAKPYNILFSGIFNGFSKKENSYKANLNMSNHEINQTTHYFLDDTLKIVNQERTSKSKGFTVGTIHHTQYLTFQNPLESIFKDKLAIEIYFYEGLINNSFSKLWLSRCETHSFIDNIFDADDIRVNDDATIEDVLTSIVNTGFLKFKLNDLIENLKNYSPIKDLKIDWQQTRRTIHAATHEQFSIGTIEGIDFQYFIDGQWLNWTQLSDGTKRLFYLIGSVTYADSAHILLIEEPEIGVHPHQLAKLMNFLKAQSVEKQIIITTHSPQVLNCLTAQELGKIIIARHEGKAGTKMVHLSEEEQKIVADYMVNDAFIGDYWTLLGFEKDETL